MLVVVKIKSYVQGPAHASRATADVRRARTMSPMCHANDRSRHDRAHMGWSRMSVPNVDTSRVFLFRTPTVQVDREMRQSGLLLSMLFLRVPVPFFQRQSAVARPILL
jgi:hypothetical protein